MSHDRIHTDLGFIGVIAPEVIVAEGVAIGPVQREQALQAALGEAQRIELLPLAA